MLANLTCIIPASIQDTGNAVMRALDNDTGGDKTFGRANLLKGGVEYIGTTVPYCNALVPVAAWWLYEPSELFKFIEEQYALRWAEEVCPTEQEVLMFAAEVIAISDTALEEVVQMFGFEFKEEEQNASNSISM